MDDTQSTSLASPGATPQGFAPPVGQPVTADAAEPSRGSLPKRGVRTAAGLVTTVAMIALLAIPIAAIAPSSWVAQARNRRLDVEQQAPYALVPAAATPVDRVIEFGDLGSEAKVYQPNGSMYFVTVSEPPQSVLSYAVGNDDPTVDFITYEDKFGTRTPQQQRVLSLESMHTSEQTAQYVALNRLGFDAKLVPGQVLVASVMCLEYDANQNCVKRPPSDESIDPGDVIVSLDGQPVGSLADLSSGLQQHKPGDVVSMTIERQEETLDVSVPLIADPDDPNRALVGFIPFDTRTVELPFELDFNTQMVGGPSAGLAFTLALTDELSPGELTGGKRIAATGTIDLDGNVGPIGGLEQKVSAVKQTGIDTFLVPVAQGEEQIAAAREIAGGDVEIIPVDTLDDALLALAKLGGDPLPKRGDG